MSGIVPRRQIFHIHHGVQKTLNHFVHPIIVIPCRNKIFYGAGHKHQGGGIPKKARRRWPIKWRLVNFNPAQIPKAWKPADYDEKHTIDYEYEEKLAQYLPGYKPKIHPKQRQDYHEEPMYHITDDIETTTGVPQVLSLTKSILMPGGLPDKIKKLKESLPNPEDNVIKVMQNAILFDLDPCMLDRSNKYKRYKMEYQKPRQERYCPQILLDFIRLSDTHGCQTSDKFFDRTNVPNLRCKTWFERGLEELQDVDLLNLTKQWKISLDLTPYMQVFSKDPLPLFADEKMVDDTKNKVAFSNYPQLPISGIKPTHNYTPQHTTGFPPSWHKPYLHTMVLQCDEKYSHKRTWGKMLVNLFGALHSHATYLYGETPQVLPRPLVGQAIASNGKDFYGMAFQLNTTDLSNNTGVKNMVDNWAIFGVGRLREVFIVGAEHALKHSVRRFMLEQLGYYRLPVVQNFMEQFGPLRICREH